MGTEFGTAAIVAAICAVALLGCGAPPPPPPTSAPPAATATPAPGDTTAPAGPEVVASGLSAPWSVAFGEDVVLISERDSGDIREIVADTTRVVGNVEGLYTHGEAGLLGIAIAEPDLLYAYSTTPGGNRVQRFALNGKPGGLSLGSAETILDGIPHGSTHDGGRIAFGPDGMLYVTTGDAGDKRHSQDLRSLGGKVLRMTPDGEAPTDNPFPGSLVWSYGHRNPQGIAWSADGTMFASEFGQDTWDELNIITRGGNYGWPQVEGIADDDRFIDPVQQWRPTDASPSGIAIVGDTIYIANLRGQRLRAVPVPDPTSSTERFTGEFGRLRDAVAAPDGTLWLLTNNTDGRGSPASDDDRLIRVPVG